MSPDPENASFAKGVHEDLLTHLSRIAELKVTSRTSTLQFADAKRNLSDIEAALGVRDVVEGSVRRAQDQVRVTVQLIDAKTDEHLWAKNYDRELKDIFAIQSEIAKQIASAVSATISPEESGRIDEATEFAEKTVKIQEGRSWNREALGLAYIAAGRRTKAMGIIAAMLKDQRAINMPKTSLAMLYFEMGETDKGFEWLEQAYASHDYYLPAWLINPHQHTEALRSDPRFQNLADRMNFPK